MAERETPQTVKLYDLNLTNLHREDKFPEIS